MYEEDSTENRFDIIIEYATEIGLELSAEEIESALLQTELDIDEISLNQPIVNGVNIPHGIYILYKGGSDAVVGWVSDDETLAANYGTVSSRVYEYNGQHLTKWSTVNDWDGYPQLVPPGPTLRKVYDGGYLLLDNNLTK